MTKEKLCEKCYYCVPGIGKQFCMNHGVYCSSARGDFLLCGPIGRDYTTMEERINKEAREFNIAMIKIGLGLIGLASAILYWRGLI